MRRFLILLGFFVAAAWCVNAFDILKPAARASDEQGGVTAQDSPRKLEQGAKNYKYFNLLQEPTRETEARYVDAIRDWLAELPDFQREKAREILKDAHPALHDLRNRIRGKKGELVSLSFDRNTPPETLPRLGQELQDLRDQLKSRLKEVEKRLNIEAGVTMGPLDGDGLWLSTPGGPDENSLPTATPGAHLHNDIFYSCNFTRLQ